MEAKAKDKSRQHQERLDLVFEDQIPSSWGDLKPSDALATIMQKNFRISLAAVNGSVESSEATIVKRLRLDNISLEDMKKLPPEVASRVVDEIERFFSENYIRVSKDSYHLDCLAKLYLISVQICTQFVFSDSDKDTLLANASMLDFFKKIDQLIVEVQERFGGLEADQLIDCIVDYFGGSFFAGLFKGYKSTHGQKYVVDYVVQSDADLEPILKCLLYSSRRSFCFLSFFKSLESLAANSESWNKIFNDVCSRELENKKLILTGIDPELKVISTDFDFPTSEFFDGFNDDCYLPLLKEGNKTFCQSNHLFHHAPDLSEISKYGDRISRLALEVHRLTCRGRALIFVRRGLVKNELALVRQVVELLGNSHSLIFIVEDAGLLSDLNVDNFSYALRTLDGFCSDLPPPLVLYFLAMITEAINPDIVLNFGLEACVNSVLRHFNRAFDRRKYINFILGDSLDSYATISNVNSLILCSESFRCPVVSVFNDVYQFFFVASKFKAAFIKEMVSSCFIGIPTITHAKTLYQQNFRLYWPGCTDRTEALHKVCHIAELVPEVQFAIGLMPSDLDRSTLEYLATFPNILPTPNLLPIAPSDLDAYDAVLITEAHEEQVQALYQAGLNGMPAVIGSFDLYKLTFTDSECFLVSDKAASKAYAETIRQCVSDRHAAKLKAEAMKRYLQIFCPSMTVEKLLMTTMRESACELL